MTDQEYWTAGHEWLERSKMIAKHVMGWVIHPNNTAHYMLASETDNTGYKVQAFHDWNPYLDPDAFHQLLARLFVISSSLFCVRKNDGDMQCVLIVKTKVFIGFDKTYLTDRPDVKFCEGFFDHREGFDAIINAAYELAQWNKDHG